MKKPSIFRRIIQATLLACCSLSLSYFSTNLNVSLTGEKAILKYWNAFTDWLASGREENTGDDVVFINVAYDKQLVDVTDELGIHLGNNAVTDRQKLDKLLDIIVEAGSYQYVMLDVFFESGYETPFDSSLFGHISAMNRIVIPTHTDGRLGSKVLEDKAGYADYTTSINENDFTKYLLYKEGRASMPLKAYTEVTGNTVRKAGLWYVDNGHLSRRVVFPKMHCRLSRPYGIDGQKTYLNLGADILAMEGEIDWSGYFKDKYIVIGSFVGDDIHTTYAGDLPGSVINYNVYLSLMKGQHMIPGALIVIYFIIFFAMAFLVLGGGSNVSQSWAWLWAKLFILYSVILTIVCIFVFAIWGQAHDIFITSTFFSVVDLINRRIKTKRESNA